MNRRLFACLAVALLSFSYLGACGDDGNQPPPEECATPPTFATDIFPQIVEPTLDGPRGLGLGR